VTRLLVMAAFTTIASSPTSAGSQSAAILNYTIYRAKCHGTAGRGDGPNSTSLNTKPHDFTDRAAMKKIQGGASVNRSNDMPPFGHPFGDREIKQLVAYVRTFCGK